jgi:hypothetical protein
VDFKIQPAVREQVKVKIALQAPSGGGKTYSALRLATGMARQIEKDAGRPARILMGNTETYRGLYYANEFKYDIVHITPPHTPEMYVEFIRFAVKEGYDILILDSTTHEWDGVGGCLEIHQKNGGTFQAWGKVTPKHNKFLVEIAESPIHIIATMRGNDQYEVVEREGGKKDIKKLGVGAIQRKGFEYEFTISFSIDQGTHEATTQKDNTHLFEEGGAVLLTEQSGANIIAWASSGEARATSLTTHVDVSGGLDELRTQVVEKCKMLGGQANVELMTLLKNDYGGSPSKIKNVNTIRELLVKLETIVPVAKNEEEKGE